MRDRNYDRLMITTVLIATVLISGNHIAPVSAASVPPEPIEGNPSCVDLNPGWIELKVDPPANGIFTDGTLSVTISGLDVTDLSDVKGPFDWASNIGVDAVFVKGGPNGNLYQYDPPPPEATGDTDLNTPLNPPPPDKHFGVSHISFCYDPNGIPPEEEPPVGGEILHIDVVALLVAGGFANSYWMLPMLASIVGAVIALTKIRQKTKK